MVKLVIINSSIGNYILCGDYAASKALKGLIKGLVRILEGLIRPSRAL